MTEQDMIDDVVSQDESPESEEITNDETSSKAEEAESATDGDVGRAPIDDLFLSPEDSDVEVVESSEVVEVLEGEQEETGLVAELREQLAAAEAERDEARNRHLRTAADLENFRKRTAREREDLRKYGIDRVVLELLPVIDNLDRALEHAEKSESNISSIVDGVRMVYRQFVTALEKHGVSSFESRGEPFDPTKHEAIQQMESADHETNTVLEQYQKGYFLHDRLIRPALVAVSKKVEPVAAPELVDVADVTEAEPEPVEVETEQDSTPELDEASANE